MKVWYLIVMLHGEVVYQSAQPMTADECALELAYRTIQIEQYAASGRPIPEEFGGESITLDDVEVTCQTTL